MSDILIIKEFVNNVYDNASREIGGRSYVCSKGCSYCCLQPIETVCWEVINIVPFIKEKLTNERFEQVRSNIIKWADFFNKNFPDTTNILQAIEAFRMVSVANRIPCPFLINNECAIYEVRPLVCRVHLIEDNPDKCRGDLLRAPSNFTREIGKSAYDKMISAPKSFTNYLPILLALDFKLPSNLFKQHCYAQY